MSTMKTKGPYFVVGTQVRYQYGPAANDSDFVESYVSKRAAQRDADTMNRERAAKKAEAAMEPNPTPEPDFDALYERHLSDKAQAQEDPREGGWL